MPSITRQATLVAGKLLKRVSRCYFQTKSAETVGLEPTRVMLLPGVAGRCDYQFRHVSERSETNRSTRTRTRSLGFGDRDVIQLHHTPTDTRMPEAGIEPTCGAHGHNGFTVRCRSIRPLRRLAWVHAKNQKASHFSHYAEAARSSFKSWFA